MARGIDAGVGRRLARRVVPLAAVTAVAAVAATLVDPLGLGASGADGRADGLLTEQVALAQAIATGREVEVTSLTGSTTRVVAKPDGGFRAELSILPARVRDDATGTWRDTDSTIVRRADGSIGPAAAATDLSFSPGGTGPLVTIANGKRRVALSWPGPLPVPTLSGSTAKYSEVAPGIDIVAEAGVTGFSTYVVIRDRAAARNPLVRDLALDVATQNVSLGETATGGIGAKDGASEVFTGTPMLMWDSRGATGAGAAALSADERAVGAALRIPENAATAVMDATVSSSRISLTPVRSMLDDPNTTYPVILDPSLDDTHSKRTKWLMLWDAKDGQSDQVFYNSSTQEGRVGYDGWSDPGERKVSRVFYQFDVSPLSGKAVTSAKFVHSLIHTPNHDCDADTYGPAVEVRRSYGFSSSTTWATQPDPTSWGGTTSNTSHGSSAMCPGSTRQEWDVRPVTAQAADSGTTNFILRMKSVSEGDREGWRRYLKSTSQPHLEVDYYSFPPTPTNLRIDANQMVVVDGTKWVRTTTPTVYADVVDPNGGSAYGYFEIRKTGTSTVVWSGVDGTDAAGTAPAVETVTSSANLQENQAYTLWAWSLSTLDTDENGAYTTRSKDATNLYFRVDKTPPSKPTVSMTSPVCRIGKVCTFALGGSADTAKFIYGFNTDNPTTETSTGTAQSVSITPQAFGPSWFTVRAQDAVGNVSSRAVFTFRVQGTAMTHKWSLDGNGTDTSAMIGTTGGPAAASLSGTWSTVDGVFTTNGIDNTALDPSDRAAAFNGTSQSAATAAKPQQFDTDQDFALSTWVKLNSGATTAVAVSQGTGTTPAFTLGHTGGAWTFTVTGANGTKATASASDPTAVGRWVHLTAMYNDTTDETELEPGSKEVGRREIVLFVDGREVARVAAPSGVRASTGGLTIGKSVANTSWWPGAIDEVRLYPGILDPFQARALATERRSAS